MVESMDNAVGTLLDALDRLKLSDNTIIIFTADNGGNMYNEIDGTTPTSNAPLRGGKATMFEGGTRVPCVVAWPGITPAGSQQDTLLQSEDFFPTLLAGLHLAPAPGQIFDGLNLLSAFKGKPMERGPIFQYFPHDPGVPDWLPAAVSVHQGDLKLIRLFHAGQKAAHRYLLYDLKQDLSETKNLAAENPAKVTELDALIERFLQRTKAVVPVPNPKFDPAQYRPELEGKQQPKGKGKPKAKSTAKVAPPTGWQTSNDVELTRHDGALLLRSSGGDPWVSTRHLPTALKPPFKLQFQLISNGKGAVVIYYSDTDKPGFSKERSLSVTVPHDGKTHKVDVTLPVENLTALRIDPGNAPGQIRIEGLKLNDQPVK
jgi:hypothetical protein